jgi:hypothetical protein
MVTVNLVKLCVGVTGVDELERLQSMRRDQYAKSGMAPVNIHITRNKPKRADEILDNGSLYWVMRRQIRVRQKIIRIDDLEDMEGKKRCGLVLGQKLIRTELRNYRPFQGWRYLEQSDVPPDLTSNSFGSGDMPPEMEEELRSLGLL